MKTLSRAFCVLIFCFPAVVAAQLLDFDSVCPSPPCPVGTLYGQFGVSFQPNTAQIVAPGTDGVTSPAGGNALLVASAPYQLTITLSRPATFSSLTFALAASASAGGVQFDITWMNAGVPVGSEQRSLFGPGAWFIVGKTNVGGFDSIVIATSGVANRTFAIDALRIGGMCYGFADVQLSDSFCNAAEWLANRSITLGCAPGLYCPSQSVTRAQMALFFQRLGNVAAPVDLNAVDIHRSNFIGGGPITPICVTQTLASTGYRRRASALGLTTLYDFSGDKTVSSRIAMTYDGGATWNIVGNYTMSASGMTGQVVSLPQHAFVDVGAGYPYRFGIVLTGNQFSEVTVDCEIHVQVFPAPSGQSAPFDAANSGAR